MDPIELILVLAALVCFLAAAVRFEGRLAPGWLGMLFLTILLVVY